MLCVVGMQGCGKSIFLQEAQECGYTIVSMGDAVRAETRKRGFPPECHGEVAEALREEKGLAAVAYLVVDKITPDCIVEGARGLEEIKVFRQHYTVDIVAIHSSPETRFKRVKKRKRSGDPRTWDEFEKRDMRELGFGIGGVFALSDYMLINESTKGQFEKECRVFLKNRERK
jgi:dephospho-CoA kinase